MTCIQCKGKGYLYSYDFDPEETRTYKIDCPECRPEGVNRFVLVSVKPKYPAWQDDREGRIASGYDTPWTPGGEI
jgi:hypothetical protein